MSANILFAGLLFGCIGSGAFVFGKRRSSATHMILGAALMGYPYFMSNTLALYGVGIALTAALFICRDPN